MKITHNDSESQYLLLQDIPAGMSHSKQRQTCEMAKPKQGKRKANEVVTDPRFAKVHTDPRFQIFPHKLRKVVIDDRFKGEAAVLAFSLPSRNT